MNIFGAMDDVFFGLRKSLKLKEGGLSSKVFGMSGQLMTVGYTLDRVTDAKKGHMASRVVGIPMSFALNAIAPGAIAGFAAFYAGEKLGDAFQYAVDGVNASRKLNFGGNYKDTTVAYTMRQKAAQELGGSLLNARTYLGKEAVLFHQ
jgi:hypothetical protein